MEASNQQVLIVEDQHIVRNLLVRYLKKMGLEALEAENGERAIELFRTLRPSVVLSDIMMPQMDGLTLLNEIKKIDRRAAVILMTGYGNEEILLKALRGGAANFFKKPFNFQEITDFIKHLFKHQSEPDLSEVYSPYLVRESKAFMFHTADADIFPIINQLTMPLQRITPETEVLNLKVGIEEMLKNAIEHGNLGISSTEKQKALEAGSYGELLKERLQESGNAEKKITIDAELTREQLKISIADEGKGFDWRSLPDLHPDNLMQYSGRGIFLTRIYFDQVIYNENGNSVTLIKNRLPA